MVYNAFPTEFAPKFEVVGCFCEYQNEILLLQRQAHKPQGNTWGLPAGKVEPGENLSQAVLREISEETGFFAKQSFVHFLKTYYIRYKEYDYVFHLFRYPLLQKDTVTLHLDEHSQHTWVDPTEALEMNLIDDLGECISLHYLKKSLL